jgi:8-oxo-dGTP pyrophosphatase MutT (NUDIX family)
MTKFFYLAPGKGKVGPFASPAIALDKALAAGDISQEERNTLMADLAEDPPTSEAQRRAMYAAASGNSTLGIPQKVGKEFVGKDAEIKGHAAGTLYVTPDAKVLLMRRGKGAGDFKGHWSLPGGHVEDGEEPSAAAIRESHEELGISPTSAGRLLDQRISPGGLAFHTFAQGVDAPFRPAMNEEHDRYDWFDLDDLPIKTHPGLRATLDERLLGGAVDLAPSEWTSLRENFAKWTREEEAEKEHAEEKKAMDAKRRLVALDKKSVRTYDQDGHLLVEMTNISKANVCPYRGEEIPDSEALGLDPNKVYMLLRDPKELEKAASTAQGKPVLLLHVPINADDHPREITVGSVAGEPVFKAPYLRAPLSVWDGEAIELIESDKQKQISCAYHYSADMTPGEYKGEHYDGVMRNIAFNHVALVEEGRAGPDVVVGDSKLTTKESDMSGKKTALSAAGMVAYGALMTHLRPRLAADAAIDFKPVFVGVTSKNFKTHKKRIAADVTKLAGQKLAKDASLEDVTEFLDCLEKEVEGVDANMEPNSAAGPSAANQLRGGEDDEMDGDEDDEKKRREFLQSKLSAEDMKAYDAEFGAGEEQDAMDEAKDPKENMVDKKAMDAAIKVALDANNKKHAAIEEAKEFVRPWVGALRGAFDSASGVYKTALDTLKVDVGDAHPDAFKSILAVQTKPGETRTAFDAAPRGGSGAKAPEGYGFDDVFGKNAHVAGRA